MNPFGPHCSFELVRVSRRQRLIAGRCAFTALILVILGFIYLSLFGRGPDSLWDFLFRSKANPKDLANFGLIFFMVYTFTQYFVANFAMAVTAATIIAEEKERNTLPFLLTTILANREIVFGKLAARVAQVMMLLASGLPVLAIMQVMGGIDPDLLWTSFVAIAACIISAAGVGAAISVRAASVKSATALSVGCVTGYMLVLPWMAFIASRTYGAIPLAPPSWFRFTLSDLLDFLNWGNLIWVTQHLGQVAMAAGNLSHHMMPILLKFVGFHLVVALLTGGWTAFRLRPILARQQDNIDRSTSKRTKTKNRQLRRPVSQTRPVLWRETKTAIGKANRKRWQLWLAKLLFLASFLPLVIAFYEGSSRSWGRNPMGQTVHEVVRSFGTMVLSGVVLHVATTASGMIGRERRQKTLDELCLTDLTNREILRDKTLGAAWSARWAIIWVALHWVVDLVVGGMHPLALVVVPPVLALYMLMAVRFGIMCSAYESTKIRAGSLSAIGMLAFGGLPWLLPLSYALIFDDHGRTVEYTALFAAGLSPPAVIGFMTLGADDLTSLRTGPNARFEASCFVAGLAVGIVLCLIIARLAWRKAISRFALTRRE